MEPQIHLADGFPAATREHWQALVAKTLKGASAESLDRTTADGLVAHAFYDAHDAPRAARPRPLRPRQGWDVRAFVADPHPARAHALILEALAGGASSILIGLDADQHPGVALGDADGFSQLVSGVLTDIAPIALDGGDLGLEAAAWLDAAVKASPAARLAFHLDPIGAFALTGVCTTGVSTRTGEAARLAARLADTYPRASLFLATGRVVHEAGGTPAGEIAFAAAAALAYAKALTDAGVSMARAWEGIVIGLSADAQPMAAIAKMRAARLVWARLTGACGLAVPCVIEARSSGRMLTRAEPWTNLVRLTCAGFAAGVGGADAVVLGTHGDAVGTAPDSTALRLARNAQIILLEEGHLGRVEDPAGGAWALEAQTLTLAQAAWDQFAAIEAQGGLIRALASGAVARTVFSARQRLVLDLAEGRRKILGVTDFAPAAPAPRGKLVGQATGIDGSAGAGGDRHCPPLTPIRLEDLV